jgi:hypothetical protein
MRYFITADVLMLIPAGWLIHHLIGRFSPSGKMNNAM